MQLYRVLLIPVFGFVFGPGVKGACVIFCVQVLPRVPQFFNLPIYSLKVLVQLFLLLLQSLDLNVMLLTDTEYFLLLLTQPCLQLFDQILVLLSLLGR